jgi:hypothetical protein
MFTSTQNDRASWFQFTHSNRIYLRSIAIQSSCLRLRLPFNRSNQILACISHLPHVCYMPRRFRSWIHQHYIVWLRVQITELRLMPLSPISIASFCLLLNIHFNAVFSSIFNVCSSLNVKDKISHPQKRICKIIVSLISIFVLLDSNQDDEILWTAWCKLLQNSIRFHFPHKCDFDLLLSYISILTFPHFKTFISFHV